MSSNLRKLAARLLRLVNLPKKDFKTILISAPRNLVHVLSEIAYNAREGVLKVKDRIKNSKVVRTLSDKKIKLRAKQLILQTLAAPLIIHALLAAAREILQQLING